MITEVKIIDGISDQDNVLFMVKSSCQRKRNVKRKVYIKKRADSNQTKQELQALAVYQAQNYDELSTDKMSTDVGGNVRRAATFPEKPQV